MNNIDSTPWLTPSLLSHVNDFPSLLANQQSAVTNAATNGTFNTKGLPYNWPNEAGVDYSTTFFSSQPMRPYGAYLSDDAILPSPNTFNSGDPYNYIHSVAVLDISDNECTKQCTKEGPFSSCSIVGMPSVSRGACILKNVVVRK